MELSARESKMSVDQELLLIEKELASSVKEDIFDLLETFFGSLGISFRKKGSAVFTHFDIQGARRFVEHLIKSAGSISAEMISIAEETHPTLVEKLLIELMGKTRLMELYKQLNLQVAGVFVVFDKKLKGLARIRRVDNYFVGFPGSLEEIAHLISGFNFEDLDNSIVSKITKSIIAYLLIKSNEFKFNSFGSGATPAYLVVWNKRIDDKRLDAVEEAIREMI